MLDKRTAEALWPNRRAKLGCLVESTFLALLFAPAVVMILALMASTSVPRWIELWLFPGWRIAAVSWGSSFVLGYGVQAIKHFGWRRAGWFKFMALEGLAIAWLSSFFWRGYPPILVIPAVIVGLGLATAILAFDGSKGYYWVYLEDRVHGRDPLAHLGPEGSPLRELSSVRNLLKVYIAVFSPFAVALVVAWLIIHFSRAH